MNVLEVKCSRSIIGVIPMNKVKNEEVRRRVEIERELAISVDQRVLSWFELWLERC